MNILNISTSDNSGAGMVSRVSNEILIKKGFNSVLVVKESGSKDNNIIAFTRKPLPGSLNGRAISLFKKFKKLYRLFFPFNVDMNYSFYGINERKKHYSAKKILSRISFKPDVIIIYWVSEFINSKTIRDLEKLTGAKLLWIMTDNAPVTGGCHYPWQCRSFETTCSDCPGILTKSKKKIVQKNLAFKMKNLPDSIELFAGSTSDYNRASNSLLFKDKKIKWIFPPVDETKFCPGDKEMARQFFGISPGKKVIFYGASEFIYLRKGGSLFLDAILQLENEKKGGAQSFNDYIILIAGKDWHKNFENIDLPVLDVGYLSEENLIKAYQAADIYISPSIEDSGPAMVLQSIMCGTPVVAFNTGIAMNIVEKGKTGYLAKLGDPADLANGIRHMLSLPQPALNEMSRACRVLALSFYTIDKYLDALIAAFPV